MDYDYKIIEEKFKQLPEEVQLALSSVNTSQSVKGISEKYNLKLDQGAVLFELTGLVMLGLVSSGDFVKKLSTETGLDTATANRIATDINSEVFNQIRSFMRLAKKSEQAAVIERPQDNSSLEAAGGFTIEREIPGNGEKSAERESLAAQAMTTKDRINLLADIENPKPAKETVVARGIMAGEPIRVEPLVDQLLKGGAAIPAEKLVRKIVEPPKVPEASKSAQPPQNLPTNDRYRESIQ